jgi:peptide deformylase
LKELGESWPYNEGCLSIPGIRENVQRLDTIVIEYYDEKFNKYTEEYSGFTARVIQHEYDHIDGVLFTDHLSSLKRKLLSKRLNNISNGNVDISYKMKFPELKKIK